METQTCCWCGAPDSPQTVDVGTADERPCACDACHSPASDEVWVIGELAA